MNVFLISQCDKNALAETRRIIDQFAERRGARTWQTSITMQGLDTLRRLLKKSARKNTAVACHWIRGKNQSELVWIVGDASRFNERGAVPTNTTKRNVLRKQDENDWRTAEDIRILAAIAALFHDMGKSSKAFQKKLSAKKPIADAHRHEWVSLRLFEAFVGKDDDRGWLTRLSELSEKPDSSWMKDLKKDGIDGDFPGPLKSLPPVAKAVGWLIVSHHRIPVRKKRRNEAWPKLESLKRAPSGIDMSWCGYREDATKNDFNSCWKFDHAPPLFSSGVWRERARRHAKSALKRVDLFEPDRYVLQLARLTLMLSDHYYSSLTHLESRMKGDKDFPLLANTNRRTGEPNQPLDEHLVGVETQIGKIVRALQSLEWKLPRIARHKGFTRRSADKRFRWQDKAYDLACSVREKSFDNGFFGVNMASTGCGKTLANGRILYALADPERGARFSIALGLRALTLQTGEVYRKKLGLGPDDLAVLVGGGAARELYEHDPGDNKGRSDEGESYGSESTESLIPDNSHVHYESSLEKGPLSEWLKNSPGASKLLQAPVLTCTIDHLTQATESLRGGHQIAPTLRLASSDLALDEPDEFDLSDLPALSRLVHRAGLLGSRVLLSSATLPPSLVEGLFEAYVEGRKLYQANRGNPGATLNIVTGWFDEFGSQSGEHATPETYIEQHRIWVSERAKNLAAKNEIRRVARISPVSAQTGKSDEELAKQIADIVATNAVELHDRHNSVDPKSGGRVSFGLVRFANIDPLVRVVRDLAQIKTPTGCRIHLCCYHSRHPLLVRSNIERRLDRLLDRRSPESLFDDAELRATLDNSVEKDHLFIVLATAVAEVGRDHDYDWAVVEPSSMRSIIQLAGRVRRHREGVPSTPNLYLLDTNFRSLKHGVGKPAFCMPGFESDHFPLKSHSMTELLTEDQLRSIDSRPRIIERADPTPQNNLVDLEHDHLRAVMTGDVNERKTPVNWWWRSNAHLCGELQRVQPFRVETQGRRTPYFFEVDEEIGETGFRRIGRDGSITTAGSKLKRLRFDLGSGVSVWGETDYLKQVEVLAEEMDMGVADCSRRYGVIDLPEHDDGAEWSYHPSLGFCRVK